MAHSDDFLIKRNQSLHRPKRGGKGNFAYLLVADASQRVPNPRGVVGLWSIVTVTSRENDVGTKISPDKSLAAPCIMGREPYAGQKYALGLGRCDGS